MLPLLNRLIELPVTYIIGIAIDRQGMCVAISSSDDENDILHNVHAVDFEFPDTGNELSEANGQVVARTVRQLIDSNRKKYVYAKINISVSDAIIRNFVVELDDIPKNEKQLNDLISWRISDLLDVKEDSIDCRFQVLGKLVDKWFVFCQAVDVKWLDALMNSLSHASVVAWNINSAHYYLHNELYQSETGEPSILVTVATENWTIEVVNEHGCPVKLITRRLRVSDEVEDVGYMTSEILRSIEAYEYASKKTITTINIEGTHDYASMLAEKLGQVNSRLVNYLGRKTLPTLALSGADSRLANSAIIASRAS